jgi:hypothetical protein
VIVRRSLLARNAKLVVTSFVTLAAAVVISIGGCAAIAGINDGTFATQAARDAASPPDDAKVSTVEGGVTADGAACAAKTTQQPSGAIHALQAATAPMIDGKLDEWACVDRIDIGPGVVDKGTPASDHVEFAMQWTPTDLYFYAHSVTAAPGVEHTGSQVFANDSVHLIIGREPAPTASGMFRTGDHQLSFDYRGRNGDYVNGNFVGNPMGAVASAGVSNAIDFQVEAKISAASLGLAGFSAGQKLVINVMLVDATSDNALGFRIWRMPPLATCPCDAPGDPNACCGRIGGQDSPTCDIRCTDTLQLD